MLVGSACYDTQQVCVYLQPFSRQMSANSGKITISTGVPLFDALVRYEGNLLTQRHQDYLIRN